MKIKILGLTLFEIQRDLPATLSGPPAAPPAKPVKSRRPTVMVPPALLPLADLHKPADLLPRTARGTLDADAALRMFGLKDVAVLWQQKYPSGSAGAALKRVVGAIGRKPVLACESSVAWVWRAFRPARTLTPSVRLHHCARPSRRPHLPQPADQGFGGARQQRTAPPARCQRAHRHRRFPPDGWASPTRRPSGMAKSSPAHQRMSSRRRSLASWPEAKR